MMRITVKCIRCEPNYHYAEAIDEKGIIVTRHISSDHDWVKNDMGITSTQKHEIYNAMYPDGWKLINRIGM